MERGDEAGTREATELPGARREGGSSLVRNSLTLISGTVASQALMFLASPLLSRLFPLAAFGDLANYNAWVSMLALLSSLRYEHAVIVARGRQGTNRVVALTMALTVASFVVYAVVAALVLWAPIDSGYLRELRRIILFIPFGVLSVCITSILIQLNVRSGQFARMASISAAQVVATVALQIGMGVARVPHALIVGTLVGYVFAGSVFLWFFTQRNRWSHIARELSAAQLRATAVLHRNFPRYTLAADALNVAVQQFVPVLVLALFNPAIAGLYAFTIRVVRTPVLVVSTAISGAMRKEAIDHLREGRDVVQLLYATVRHLVAIGFIPFLVLLLAAPTLFGFVFGDPWVDAGRLARILSPAILLEFVALPLAVVFLVTDRQRYSFWIQLVGFVLLVAALIVGRAASATFEVTAMLVSGVMVAVNLATVLLALRAARRNRAAIALAATRRLDVGAPAGGMP